MSGLYIEIPMPWYGTPPAGSLPLSISLQPDQVSDPAGELVVMCDDGNGNLVPCPKWTDEDMDEADDDWYGEY